MSEETSEVAAWLDNCLVKLAARFGGFTRNQPDTFEFPGTFSMLPQWFFNLRRSPFMQVNIGCRQFQAGICFYSDQASVYSIQYARRSSAIYCFPS